VDRDSYGLWRSRNRIPSWGVFFPNSTDSTCSHPVNTGSFPDVQRLGRGFHHPPQSSAEVKETVDLYRYSPSGHTWSVLGRALHLPYTGCPRRNVPDFGSVFLMLKYTDITQNTYVQSWTVTEIKAREKCGFLAVPRTVPGPRDVIPICCALSVLVYSRLKGVLRCNCTCKVLGNPKDNHDMIASVFVVQFNGFMLLTS